MRKSIDRSAVIIMALLCLTWGLQQTAIKATAQEVTPIMQVAVRSGIAAVLVGGLGLLVLRERWLKGIALRSGLVVGVLFALEFLLVAEGLRLTSASHIVVFLYTAPLFTAIGLQFLLAEERLNSWQWFGMALSFSGIVITFIGPHFFEQSAPVISTQLVGDLFGLGAGVAWGMTTVAVRTSRLSEAPPSQTLFYQLAGACLFLLPITLLTGQFYFNVTSMVLASMFFQTIGVSFISFLVWFWLLRHYLASRLSALSFLTPLFGVTFGVFFLDEKLSYWFIVGASMVLTGAIMVNKNGEDKNRNTRVLN